MKLVNCSGLSESTTRAQRPYTKHFRWAPKLLSAFAIAGSVLLTGATASADDGDLLAQCLSGCHKSYLRELLACGEAAQACLEGFIYWPWYLSPAAQENCLIWQGVCETQASTRRYQCQTSCYQDSTQRIQAEPREILESSGD